VSPRAPALVSVSGTSYSGSTALCLMLGHGAGCFAAGEVAALFEPSAPHHREPRCGCGDSACRLWLELRECGAAGFLAELARRSPELHTFVDSSKSIDWIAARARERRAAGGVAREVLIWKAPLAFARSMSKRGRSDWARTWVDYHLRLFSALPDAICVSHAALVRNPAAVLAALCAALDLPYFAGKECYWEQTHHLLFGNHSARRHLYEAGSELARRAEAMLPEFSSASALELPAHRSIDELPLDPEWIEQSVETAREPWLAEIEALLAATPPGEVPPDKERRALLRAARPGLLARIRHRLAR
jgi:hypothetical protein